MTKRNDPIITPSKENYTCITFYPDYNKFKIEKLEEDMMQLFKKRAYDIAGSL